MRLKSIPFRFCLRKKYFLISIKNEIIISNQLLEAKFFKSVELISFDFNTSFYFQFDSNHIYIGNLEIGLNLKLFSTLSVHFVRLQ